MPVPLSSLLQQRDAILREILSLDFRSGSITTTSGKCGKPNCRCHQAGSPGHGPNYRLTRKQGGKTVPRPFPRQPNYARLNRKWKPSIDSRASVTNFWR